MRTKIRRVLLIDLPTYQVHLPDRYRQIFTNRLRLQAAVWQNRVGASPYRPPLAYSRGLLTLATVLESSRFNVQYLNYTDPADRARIPEAISKADAVGITTITPSFPTACQIAKLVRSKASDVLIIIGGPHVTADPTGALAECDAADMAIAGDADLRITSLFGDPESMIDTPGVAYRSQGEIFWNPQCDESLESRRPYAPAYHLLNRPLDSYSHNLQLSRGCPYTCSFCSDALIGKLKQDIGRSIESVIKELRYLAQHLPRGTLVHFSDSILNASRSATLALAKEIQALNTGFIFSFDTRADLVREEGIAALTSANFRYIRLGFETTNAKQLDISNKRITIETQLNASETIRRVCPSAAIHAYMISGLPGTTHESMRKSAADIHSFVVSDIVDVIGNKILVPYPGTAIFNNPEKYGMKIETKRWNLFDRRSPPVFSLDTMSSSEIYDHYILQEENLCKAYAQRITCNNLQSATNIFKPYIDYIHKNYL